jgi:hypothetical protein
MLSIEEMRKHLDDKSLSDKKVEEIRDGLYGLAEIIFEKWLQDKKKEGI